MGRRAAIGGAMSDAQRQKRRRDKLRALRTASAVKPIPNSPLPPQAPLDLLGSPETIASRIFESLGVDGARSVAMVLQQRLLQGGCWPMWRLPML